MSDDRARLPGFYKKSVDERRAILRERFSLSERALDAFVPASGLCVERADHMVENAIGVFSLPLGVAVNFVVDGRAVLVPMAVEEPSVVAACSHVASLAFETGGFVTDVDPAHMIAQVQLVASDELAAQRALGAIDAAKAELMREIDAHCAGLASRGGGARDVRVRKLAKLSPDDEDMLVVHLVVDCVDAMGANAMNTVAEGVAPKLAELTGAEVGLRILSNLADERLARATMEIPLARIGEDAAQKIVRAARFAARDPYRAATHNKGIMNGIDALAIATGNDWRSIEAAAHAFAARDGQYTALTEFVVEDGHLVGRIELPMAVGVVGGSTQVHPGVRASLELLGPFAESAKKLAGLMAAVGLAQNLGALKALATEGIQRGHMRLHARQVALAVGARDHEVDALADALVDGGDIRAAAAERALETLRASR